MCNHFKKNIPFAMFKNGEICIYDKFGNPFFGVLRDVILKTSKDALPKVSVEIIVNLVNDEAEMKEKAAKNDL